MLLDCVIIQSEAFETAWFEIFDENIGTVSQLAGQLQVCWIIEIENERALVAVDSQIIGCYSLAFWRHPGACVISRRTLDLDHRCAEVTKQHRAIRSGKHA